MTALALSLSLAACNPATVAADKAAAEGAVAKFHEQLNAQQYAAIYAEADELFRGVGTEGGFRQLFEAVRTKLGAVRSTELKSWNVRQNFGTMSGTFIELVYETRFERGVATETFNWRTGDPPRLVGYNINSQDLLTN